MPARVETITLGHEGTHASRHATYCSDRTVLLVSAHLLPDEHELLVRDLELAGQGRVGEAQVDEDVAPAARRGLREALLHAPDSDVPFDVVLVQTLDAIRDALHAVVADHRTRGVPDVARLAAGGGGGVEGLLLEDAEDALDGGALGSTAGRLGQLNDVLVQVLLGRGRGLVQLDGVCGDVGVVHMVPRSLEATEAHITIRVLPTATSKPGSTRRTSVTQAW